MITSPAREPKAVESVVAESVVAESVVAESMAQGSLSRIPSKSKAPESAEGLPRPEPAIESPSRGMGGSSSMLKKLPLIAVAVIVLALIPAVIKIFLDGRKEGKADARPQEKKLSLAERRDNAYRAEGWIPEAESVLERFHQAQSVSEKVALTIQGSQIEAEMVTVYQEFDEEENRTPVEFFSPIPLGDADTKRGIFFMAYDRVEQFAIRSFFRPIAPLRVKYGLEAQDSLLWAESDPSNFIEEPLRVMAFFLRTKDGLKLDWALYAQSKFRLFDRFLRQPERGKRETFRVLIREDIDIEMGEVPGATVYRFSDPAYATDYTMLSISDETTPGRVLAPLKWRGKGGGLPVIRNATVSLVWSDDPVPVLELGEFICWEYLGLGGQRGNWQQEGSEQ